MSIIHGTSSNNTIYGTAGRDSLYGEGGNDFLIGRLGDDLLYGGSGNDRLVGNDGDDREHGGAGHDVLNGSAGRNTLWGDAGDDTLFNGYRNYGGEGNDLIQTGPGDAWSYGGNGNDVIDAQGGTDQVWGEGGDDTITNSSNDGLHGSYFAGGDGNDTLDGSFVDGGNGNDTVYGVNAHGGNGADVVGAYSILDTFAEAAARGEGGNDTVVDAQSRSAYGLTAILEGGAGVDTYVDADGFIDINAFRTGEVPTSESIYNFSQDDGDKLQIREAEDLFSMLFVGWGTSPGYGQIAYDWSGDDTRVHVNEGATYTVFLRGERLELTGDDFS